jgi:hypothetical protein
VQVLVRVDAEGEHRPAGEPRRVRPSPLHRHPHPASTYWGLDNVQGRQ